MAVSPGEKKSGRIYEVTVRQDLLYSGNGYQVCKKVKRETGMEPEFLVESKAPNEIPFLRLRRETNLHLGNKGWPF